MHNFVQFFFETKRALVLIFTLFACLVPNRLIFCSPLLFQLFKCGADSVVGIHVVVH